MPGSPVAPSRSLHLTDLIGKVFAFHDERERESWRRAVQEAAKLALAKPILVQLAGVRAHVDGNRIVRSSSKELSSTDSELIVLAADASRRAIEALRDGEDLPTPDQVRLLPQYGPIRSLVADKLRRSRRTSGLWQCLQQELFKRLDVPCDATQLAGLGAYYANGWNVPSDDQTCAIARLHERGFTDELLALLHSECPEDATAAGLPATAAVEGEGPSPRRRCTRRNRVIRDATPRRPTPRQLEAVQLFGEHKGNKAAAARAMGVHRKTFDQHYKAGLKNVDLKSLPQPKTRRLPTDRRGQPLG